MTRRCCRRGALNSVELLLVLPVMLAIVLGVVEYSLLLAAEARYASASREGARVAAVGGSESEIETAVKDALLNTEASLVTITSDIYSDSMTKTPKVTGETVTVTVTVDACAVVPDFLRIIGISICGYTIGGQTKMRKE
jgi:Flp pilus assembly protein TadG